VTSEESSLLAVERQRIILEILERDGVVRNAELKELLGVSAVTVRSDLRELETAGACEIVWGGAVSKRRPATERGLILSERTKLHPEVKKRIGSRATQLVEVGQTIIVDAGSTTVELVHHLSRDLDFLRIVTPALNVAAAAAQFPNVELVMTGGILRHLTRSMVGPQVVLNLQLVNADWVFLASGGFSIEHGVTTSNMLEIDVKRVMVQQSARVALMADSSKLGKVLPLTVMPISALDVLITDDGLSESDAQAFRELGVEVLKA
jgi:DeoR/GlpR family transcriptional regulator of sugar metabolism